MLPSLLAREIQNGLKHFLKTGFEPSDHLFAGVMQRFTDDESRWMKGPYIQVAAIRETLTRRRHEPIPVVGRWLGRVVMRHSHSQPIATQILRIIAQNSHDFIVLATRQLLYGRYSIHQGAILVFRHLAQIIE